MTDELTVFEQHQVLKNENQSKRIREAVEKAKQLVEHAKEESRRTSWREALRKLVLKYHRRLPRSMVRLEFSGLTGPMEVWTLSLDPSDTKYWCYGGHLYSRYQVDSRAKKPDPDELQDVYVANMPEEDAASVLKVLEFVRDKDLSSQVYVPKGTVLFEYEPLDYRGVWTGRRCTHEMYAYNLDIDGVLNLSEDHLRSMLGIETVKDACLYMPGLNQVVRLRVDGKALFVARPPALAS